jgi:hypothetical protein
VAVMWSDSIANQILNAVVRQQTFTLPAACYAGLCTSFAEPTATGLGSAVEAGFTGYARAQLTTAIMAVPGTPTARQTVSSGGVISFGTPTAAIDALPLAWLVLFSAVTGGTYLGYGPLTAPVTPVIGSALTIATSNLIIRQT